MPAKVGRINCLQLGITVAGEEVTVSKFINTPFGADHEEPQFMDHYSTMPGPGQRLVIVILFVVILAGIVILRDMLKTTEESSQRAGG